MKISFLYGILAGVLFAYLAVAFSAFLAPKDDKVFQTGIGGAPPQFTQEAPIQESSESAVTNDLDALVAQGKFTILLEALSASGLSEKIAGPEKITIFAPTDDAFLKVPPDMLYSLMTNRDSLRTLLNNHIVIGIVDGESGNIKTLNGNNVNLKSGSPMTIEERQISETIETSNGIIYVIDDILFPPDYLLETPQSI